MGYSDHQKVSVVITCYNYARYLQGCIESVLGQTWQNLEIIVVNDGSTDHTDEVIAPYMSDERIHYIKQRNAGQAHAKNIGIRNAKGAFIAFLDADDMWVPTKLERQIPLFTDEQIGVVYSLARYIDQNDDEVVFNHVSPYLAPRKGWVTDFLIFDNFIPFSSSIVRRECFERVGLFDESIKMGIDWDLWLRFSVHFLFQFVNEPLLLYRVGHPGQMSQDLEARHKCADRITASFLDKNPGILTKDTVRDAFAYTYLSRGYYYRSQDIMISFTYYWKAVKCNPFSLRIWKSFVKTILISVGVIKDS